MISAALEWLGRLSLGWKVFLTFCALMCISTAFEVWGERHFFREFSSELTAQAIYWGRVAAGVGLGALAAQTAYDKTHSMAWGTLAFFAVAISVAFTITAVFGQLPGVSRRLNAIGNSDCHIEYDGRSSWTEC